MPTFYAKGISIQVSVAGLPQTTSPGIPTSVPLKHIESVFAEDSIAGTLFEHPVRHDGEDNNEQQLQFLDDLIPFYMRHVGKHFFENQVNKDRIIRPKRIPNGVKVSVTLNIQLNASCSLIATQDQPSDSAKPPQKPHAVSLTVFLSPASFQPYLKPRLTPRQRNTKRDIKINAYLNGALLSSRIIAKEYARDRYLNKNLIVRMTGRSTGDQKEQALVLVPPGQTAGTIQEKKRKMGVAVQRWEDISRSLKKEVEELLPDHANDSLAEGLRGLAAVEMPAEVEEMHKVGRTFSIVDVVVTLGAFRGKLVHNGIIPVHDGTGRPINPGPGYAFVLDSKQTAEEEFQDIAKVARDNIHKATTPSNAADGASNTQACETGMNEVLTLTQGMLLLAITSLSDSEQIYEQAALPVTSRPLHLPRVYLRPQ